MKTKITTITILMFLASSSLATMHAEQKNICEVFLVLTQNCEDFTPLKGAKLESPSFSYASTIEVDRAEKSYITSFTNSIVYKAHYGTYDSESLALAKVTELQNILQNCFGVLSFHEAPGGVFGDRIFRIKQKDRENNNIFQMYKAAFKIAEVGGKYEVTFEYPQTVKDMFTNKKTNSFTFYEGLTIPATNTEFAKSLQRITKECADDFKYLIGKSISSPDMFNRFQPEIIVSGYDDCYIEDRTNNIIYFVIPFLERVDQPTLNAQAKLIIEKVNAALGSDYAYTVTDDQTEISYVRKDKPAVTVATLLLTNRAGKYSLKLLIHGAHNPI